MPQLASVGGVFGYGRPTPSLTDANLVLWYDPSNPASYSGSGTTVTDLSPSPVNGTLANITFTSPSFAYNGSNSQVTVPDAAKLNPGAGDWTMEAWFNTTAFKTGSSGVILGKFDSGGRAADVSYSIRTNSSGRLYSQIGDGLGNFVDSTNYQSVLSTWAQVVYVWKNIATNSLETFINGESIGSVSHSLGSILNSSGNLHLGSYNGGEYAQWFNGRIGIVRLYNAALSAPQILQNYTADKSIYGL